MKKLIISIFILISLILCGCNNTENQILDTFTIVSEIESQSLITYQKLNIVYDNETKIMYYIYQRDRSISLTPIYNTDGSIKIYTEE